MDDLPDLRTEGAVIGNVALASLVVPARQRVLGDCRKGGTR